MTRVINLHNYTNLCFHNFHRGARDTRKASFLRLFSNKRSGIREFLKSTKVINLTTRHKLPTNLIKEEVIIKPLGPMDALRKVLDRLRIIELLHKHPTEIFNLFLYYQEMLTAEMSPSLIIYNINYTPVYRVVHTRGGIAVHTLSG